MDKKELNKWIKRLDGIVPENLVTAEVIALRKEQDAALALMAKKNADYGNAFNKGCDAMGEAYGLCRMFDKANRFIKLASDKVSGYYNPNVADESINDTIIDLGNYCQMYLAWVNNLMECTTDVSNGVSIDGYSSNVQALIKCGYSMYSEVSKTIVTDEILTQYDACNLAVDSNRYVYTTNADGSYINVIDNNGELVYLDRVITTGKL